MVVMREFRRCISGLVVILPVALAFHARASVADPLRMQVGEVRVLAVPEVARVAVGDGHVLNAVTTEEKEVIVFARNEGSTALQVWSADGKRRQYEVDVAPEGSRRIEKELRDVLARIPGIRVSSVGDKLLVEGDGLADEYLERVNELAKRYPQLLNFTGRVGWDSMVLLDVQVLEIPRSLIRDLGVRWQSPMAGGLNAALAWDGGSRRLADRPGENVVPAIFPVGMAAGYLGASVLWSAQLHAMLQQGRAMVLAQPQLLARSGSTAEFLAGGEVPYSSTDANGSTNTAFKPYGVSLKITPLIERGGVVRSRIEVEVSSVDHALSVENGPALKTRRASTEFNVRSGQTLVLAGFLSRDDSRNVDRVPGLGSLPILGGLFRAVKTQRNDTELAVFVTPVVVAADHPDIERRVRRGDELIREGLGDSPLLNVPVRERPPVPKSQLEPAQVWRPWAGEGGQWSKPDSIGVAEAVGAVQTLPVGEVPGSVQTLPAGESDSAAQTLAFDKG
ncbi:MAG TPA: pilus assembly protein N-terminal domain-containing protein [Burkholderiaceae bacterium]|nr:pilus assembly protein N-terminal domain-containing protein [Burkholderiaceae bacterium]